jgi:hypothetical protein
MNGEVSMHGIKLAGALCAAGLAGALAGVALGQQARTPPTESKGFRTRHWEENRGANRVVVIAVDIVRK